MSNLDLDHSDNDRRGLGQRPALDLDAIEQRARFWFVSEGTPDKDAHELNSIALPLIADDIPALIAAYRESQERVRELEGELSELRNTLYDQQRTAEAEHGQAMMDANGDPYA